MPTDDDRREVARRLREIRPCKSGHIKWWEIARALGLKQPAGWFGWEKFEPDSANRLADLIEPGEPSGHECVPGECPLNARHGNDSIDRDALLALADEMKCRAKEYVEWFDENSGTARELNGYARRIREAIGVKDEDD